MFSVTSRNVHIGVHHDYQSIAVGKPRKIKISVSINRSEVNFSAVRNSVVQFEGSLEL